MNNQDITATGKGDFGAGFYTVDMTGDKDIVKWLAYRSVAGGGSALWHELKFLMPLIDLRQFYCTYQATIVGYSDIRSTPWNAPANPATNLQMNWQDFRYWNWFTAVPSGGYDWNQSLTWGRFYDTRAKGIWVDSSAYYQYVWGNRGGIALFNAPGAPPYRVKRDKIDSGPYGYPPIMSINLNPQTVVGGGTVTATVTLCQPIPSTVSQTVTLSSDNPAAIVPQSITISGTNKATFQIYTNSVSAPVTISISGTTGAVTMSAPLYITPPPLL